MPHAIYPLSLQVVLMVTGISKQSGADVAALSASVERMGKELEAAGVRCTIDSRDNYTNAWK